MSCTRTLEFCVNHTFLLDPNRPKSFDENFVHRFKSIKPQLENFHSFYKKYSDSSAQEFKNSSNIAYVKEFVLKLSQFLNLSCDIAFQIIHYYFLIDGKIPNQNIESMLTRGFDSVSLIKEIGKFYHQERLSLAKIVRYAFSNRKEEWQIIANIILQASNHNDKSSLFGIILSHYDAFVQEISNERSTISRWEESLFEEKWQNSLEEQAALLETLLLGIHSMKGQKSVVTIREVFRVLKATSKINGKKGSVIVDRIEMLQSLVFIEAVSGYDSNDTMEMVTYMNGTILGGARGCGEGLLLLFYSLMSSAHGNREAAGMAEEAVVRMGLFKTISSVLSCPPYKISASNCSHLELVIHHVIFDLLSLLCRQIQINSLPAALRADFIALMCQLIRPITQHTDVKLQHSGFLKMMEDLSHSFPANLDLLKIVSSMISQSEQGAKEDEAIVSIISEYLDNLSWFCDNSDKTVDGGNILLVDDDNDDDNGGNDRCARRCILKEQYRPYSTEHNLVIIERGQQGYLMQDCVLWAISYSCWEIVAAEIEVTKLWLLGKAAANDGSSLSAQLQRIETVLEFLATCITCDVKREYAIDLFFQLWPLVDSGHIAGDGVIVRMIDLATRVLAVNTDHEIVARIVTVDNLFPVSHVSGDRTMSNDSKISRAWQNIRADPTNVAIVMAYLRFSLRLVEVEKLLPGDSGIIPSSLIFGSIVFVATNLLVDLPQLSLPHSGDVIDLMSKALVFLNEILSLDPTLYTELSGSRKQRLHLIRSAAVDVVVSSPPTLRSLFSLSSIDVDLLVKHTNVSSQMLVIDGVEENLSNIVVMALSALNFLMCSEHNSSDQDTTKAIFECLTSTVTSTTRGAPHPKNTPYLHRYVLSLLQLLVYPYGSKVARMALVVLRLVVVNTNVSVVASLGEKSHQVRDMLMRYIGAQDQDQMMRALVFEFLADCVLSGRRGIVQLLFEGEDHGAAVYHSCVEVLTSFQIGDCLTMVLLVAIGKFLSSLWISDSQSILVTLKNYAQLWPSLLVPVRCCMDRVLKHEQLDLPLYDYLGNVFGLFAMEIFSSHSQSAPLTNESSEFMAALGSLFEHNLFANYLEVFDRSLLTAAQMDRQQAYLERVPASTTWWKTLLLTAMATTSTNIMGAVDQCGLVHSLLHAVDNVLFSVQVGTDGRRVAFTLADSLVSCALHIVHKRAPTMTGQEANGILIHVVILLSTVSPSTKSGAPLTHHCHADLLSAASLIILHHNGNIDHVLLGQLAEVAEKYIRILTVNPLTAATDSKTLVQALSTFTASARRDDCVSLLLQHDTLTSLLALLQDLVQSSHICEPCPALLTLLTLISTSPQGSSRLLLHPSLSISLNTDLPSSQSSVAFLRLSTRLIHSLVQAAGDSAHHLALTFIGTHYHHMQSLIDTVHLALVSPSSPTTVTGYEEIESTLELASSLWDLLWHTASTSRGLWSLHWSQDTVRGLEQLLAFSVNTLITYIVRQHHASRSMNRHASLSLEENETVCRGGLDGEVRAASVKMEAAVYRSLHSALCLYARLTDLASEERIYLGWEHTGAKLAPDFGEHTRAKSGTAHVSFGSLFSLLNSTQSLLLQQIDAASAPLGPTLPLDRDLLRQTHEVLLGLIVSHSLALLAQLGPSHQHQHQQQRTLKNNFLLNIKSELRCYLDGLSKSRRRSTLSLSSPIGAGIGGPKVTSTPFAVAKTAPTSMGESLDRLCAAVDSFRNSLDSF